MQPGGPSTWLPEPGSESSIPSFFPSQAIFHITSCVEKVATGDRVCVCVNLSLCVAVLTSRRRFWIS